ncbi:MAG: glycosyltransferase family 4 protein [Chitinophagales bacterium]
MGIINKKSIWVFYQDGGTPNQGWGERHLSMAKEWINHGYEVTIFAANRSHRYINQVEFQGNYKIENYDGVQYCWVKVPGYKKAKSIVRIISWLIYMWRIFFVPKSIKRPDIIIASSIPLFPVINALYWKRKTKCRFIFEIRDIWPLTPIELGNYSKFNPFILLLRRIEKKGYRKADHVVSVLEMADKHIEQSIKRSVEFTWISNGIPNEILNRKDSLNSEMEKLFPKNKFIVGYAGSIGQANNMYPLLDAARILLNENDYHFVIVGEGPEKNNLIRKARGLDNITFLNKVNKYQVQSVLDHFDLNFLSWSKTPIYRFGISPNKLFDYMLSTKPILMAGNIDESALLETPSLYTVPANDSAAIAKAIKEISAIDKQKREELGNKSREFLLDNFTYNKLAHRYLEIFRNEN